MKKMLMILCTFLMVLSLPMFANANLLGTGDLNVTWSSPYSGGSPNYYLDYDGIVASSDFGYTTGLEEVFCVSKEEGNGGDYSFYTITDNLDNLDNFNTLSQAAWIADNWTTYATSESNLDVLKGEAQKAIWKVMGVMDRLDGKGLDYDIYNTSADHIGYLTSNWYFADSNIYQDFLTPANPVPEPATMLLLGIGMIGMGIVSRRKIKP